MISIFSLFFFFFILQLFRYVNICKLYTFQVVPSSSEYIKPLAISIKTETKENKNTDYQHSSECLRKYYCSWTESKNVSFFTTKKKKWLFILNKIFSLSLFSSFLSCLLSCFPAFLFSFLFFLPPFLPLSLPSYLFILPFFQHFRKKNALPQNKN